MDYIDFCKKYYATTKIPISLLLGTAGKYSTIGELFSVEPLTDYPVLAGGPNPSIHFYSSEIIYGCICIEETDYVIILGPIFECPVTPHRSICSCKRVLFRQHTGSKSSNFYIQYRQPAACILQDICHYFI